MHSQDIPLLADRLRNDPRIHQAKQLVLEAIADHQSTMEDVRPADSDLAESYRLLLEQLGNVRGAPPYFPYIASGLGNGPWVELADGSVKLDFISGIGVHGLGHSHRELVGAAIDAAIDDTIMQGNLQQHRPSVQLCQRLLDIAQDAGASLDHCLLSTSGAMANENALKVLFHAKAPADRVIAFESCFAGRTLALAALTDRSAYREGLPATIHVDYLPFYDPVDPEGSTERAVSRLKELLQRYPGKHAAFWAETIAGEGGYLPGDRSFFEALLAPIKEAGMLTVLDEVQTFGRTSCPLAAQHFGLAEQADIITVGKITQVCATMYRSDLKPTAPILSQTFTGASSSIAAALATLSVMHAEGCYGPEGRNMQNHAYFAGRLSELSERLPGLVSGPFGCGMMVAFTPGDGSLEVAKAVVKNCYGAGLMCFLCGRDPYRIRFLPPPAAVTRGHIDRAVDILAGVLSELK